MSRLFNLFIMRACVRELLQRYKSYFEINSEEIEKAKLRASDINSRIKKLKEYKSNSKIDDEILRLTIEKSKYDTFSTVKELNADDKKRMDELQKAFNANSPSFRLSLKRGDDLSSLMLKIERLLRIELSGKEKSKDRRIPYFEKVLKYSPLDKEYMTYLKDLAEVDSRFKPCLSRNNLSDLYKDYFTIDKMYFQLAYPDLMNPEAYKTSPRTSKIKVKDSDGLGGMYIGLALGAWFIDKKYDSLYLALGYLQGKDEKTMDKDIEKICGLSPSLIQEDELELLKSIITTKGQIIDSILTKGRYVIQGAENGTLKYLDDIFSHDPQVENFDTLLLSAVDQDIFTYNLRRGAIIGAVLGAYFGLEKLFNYYASEIKELMNIMENKPEDYNIMNLSSLLKNKK